ncbi:MAG: arginine--tRNA ligase [Alphaproteobacteria bacterium]
MNIKEFLNEEVLSVLKNLGYEAQDALVLRSNRPELSDYQSNVAMPLAKMAHKSPREIATQIATELEKKDFIAKVSVDGPGFINMSLNAPLWDKAFKDIFIQKENFGKSNLGRGQKINVEFLSANPTGPLHVGHSRGAIFGDTVARLLAQIGYDVTKEYYVNDYGKQVDVLAESVYWRYEELFGRHAGEKIPEGRYPGDYVIPVAQSIKEVDGDKWLDKTDWLEYFKEKSIEQMLKLIQSDAAKLGIKFDVFSSEKSLVEQGGVDKTVAQMREMNLLYRGVLPKPKGEETEDWAPVEQTLFRAKDFGDDGDRVILRADGSKTYFTSDIAYHVDKFNRGFHQMVDIFGADHGGYVKRLKAAVKALTNDQATLDIALCQVVSLQKDGKPFRMSKRAGNFVLVDDILEEIDADAFRLFMLTKSADSQMSFDLAKTKEQSKDNPVFYIQYASARTYSVLNTFEKTFGAKPTEKDLDMNLYATANDIERELIQKMLGFQHIVEVSALNKTPHLLAGYLYEIAGLFHSLWTIGAKSGHRFVEEADLPRTRKNLALVLAVQQVLKNGLMMLGITPKTEMARVEME